MNRIEAHECGLPWFQHMGKIRYYILGGKMTLSLWCILITLCVFERKIIFLVKYNYVNILMI